MDLEKKNCDKVPERVREKAIEEIDLIVDQRKRIRGFYKPA